MKLEPVGHINAEQLAALIAGNEDQATITSDWKLPSDTPLYAIPKGYVVVPVEPTEDMLVSGQEAWVICKTNRSAVEDCEHSAAVWKAMIAAKEQS